MVVSGPTLIFDGVVINNNNNNSSKCAESKPHRLRAAPKKTPCNKIRFEWEYSCLSNDDNDDDDNIDDINSNNNNKYDSNLWSNCFISNYNVARDGVYINKVINSNKILLFVISSCKRNPKYLDADKCSLPIHSFLICKDFYAINNAFYLRDTTYCNKTGYSNDCQWLDIIFFWSYIIKHRHLYNTNIEWVTLFEDDVSFCSGIFKLIWNLIKDSNCTKLNNINRIEFSVGGLGNMLKINSIDIYLKLVKLLWNMLRNPNTHKSIYPGLDTAVTHGVNDNRLKLENGAYEYGYYYMQKSLLWHPQNKNKESHFFHGIKIQLCYKDTTDRNRKTKIKWINADDLQHPFWF